MSIPLLHNSRVSLHLFSFIFFIFCPGLILCADVTLSSMEIFTTHEWLKASPTVYFKCKEENKTLLPDVKKKHNFYSFKGEESWQPMTNFSNKKCKRCGLYEEDRLLSDYEFDEWEFCPSDFTAPDGKYIRVKENEFNATFMCPECLSFAGGSTSTSTVAIAASDWNDKRKGVLIAVLVLLTVLVSAGVIVGVMGAFKYWQKKKREKDQARFLKLFEDGDDIEDELGLGTIL
ncbi:hypothetical protein Lal_00023316 [Lupinus albus]|uniref:DUF7953 domain-containing protein n=1 Tax=Lupinus albus TaxID=3870 RepID=A0A6A4NTE7_LUPAL|nr:hypothetical protein Lalb_Chr20g0113041 [Lupinus albus]KAF1881280.1 hypothetical protein Lal_00023316 [Lupinus albus]